VKVMGIVNCTPDSFSDGGMYLDAQKALDQVSDFLDLGIDFIDIGGQSTRPGANSISSEEEWQRVVPVLDAVRENCGHAVLKKISIDSFYPELWLKAVSEYGVGMINSVIGARQEHKETLEELCDLDSDLAFAAMHMHGSPQSMQDNPLDDFASVHEALKRYQANLQRAGFKSENIWLDPGVGFGKTDKLNFKLIAKTGELAKSGNLLYGVSRKSFLGRWLEIPESVERDHASKGLELGLAAAGAGMIRTHAPLALCRFASGERVGL